jgi:small ligand-binding sensory domain FIST
LSRETGEFMRWASAVTERPRLEDGVAEVTAAVRRAIGPAPVDLALVFVSPHFAARYAELPERIGDALACRALVGCSAGGVIGGGHEVEQRPGLSLTAATLPDVQLETFALDAEALPDADAPPAAWRAALGVSAATERHFILLADPFSFPAELLIAGLDYACPESPKVGGLASGAARPGGNALFLDRRVLDHGAVGVALSGNVVIDTVVAQGCRPIGQPLHVTRCDRNVLHELDGKSPLRVLQELAARLSAADRELMTHSLFLGLAMDELALEHRAGEFLIRNLIGVDPEHGALAVGEQLRSGQCVQFHLRDARTSAADLEEVLGRYGQRGTAAQVEGALLFSCLGRGLHLYGRPDHDTEVFRRAVGEVPLGGFFCNGEIGPVAGKTHLHGYTSSFGLFRPAAPGVLESP